MGDPATAKKCVCCLLWPVAASPCKQPPNSMHACLRVARLRAVTGSWYRLRRVLEILLVARRPLAELDLDTAAPLDHDFRCFFLNRPRACLYRRIDARVEQMIAGGLLQVCLAAPCCERMHAMRHGLRAGLCASGGAMAAGRGADAGREVRSACDRLPPGHGLPAALPPGPRPPEGGQPGGPCGLASGQHMLLACSSLQPSCWPQQVQLVHDIQRASRNLCHRQLSWFRDEPLFTWLDADRQPEVVTADIVAQLRSTAPTGGVCAENGRLTKEQERELKMYMARLCIFDKEDVIQSTLEQVLRQCA